MKSTATSPGFNLFKLQLDQLEKMLKKASQSKNPALTLYQTPARQILFYLQALSRIYKKIHNEKRFERMRLTFRSIENQLGKIDYYDAFIKEFSKQKNFPETLTNQLKKHYNEELSILNGMLKNDGWLNSKSLKLAKIKEDLKTAKWESELLDRKSVGKMLIKNINKIKEKYTSGELNFNEIELGVHEFRRQIRWISIYAQVLNGLIQLKKVNPIDSKIKKYLTKEILSSPFNKLPSPKKGIKPIYIQESAFYALSWLIAQSGKLKDLGLKTICLDHTLIETNFSTKKEIKRVYEQLKVDSLNTPKHVKKEMKILADDFIHNAKILTIIQKDIQDSIEN